MASLDRRYTIAREYCGHARPRFVARFCGDWLGQSRRRHRAVAITAAHRAAQLRAMRSRDAA